MRPVRNSRLARGARAFVVAIGVFFGGLASFAGAAQPVDEDWTLVRAGHNDSHEWAMFVSRSQGAGGSRRPCVAVALERRHSGSGSEGSVGLWSCSRLAVPYPPNLVESIDPLARHSELIIGIAAPPAIRVLAFEMGDGDIIRVALNPLTSRQRASSGVGRGRFGLLPLRQEACIHQMIGYGREEKVVYVGPSQDCTRPAVGRDD